MTTVIQIRCGGDRNFSYLIADEQSREAAAVDPGSPPDLELGMLEKMGWNLRYIICTHDHFDHTGGIKDLARKTGAKTAMHSLAHFPHEFDLGDGSELPLGTIKLRIIHTPGHTEDSICILAGNDLITGDTLFVGKVGGTEFGADARAEYESLHHKLMILPPDTRIWPGHDYGVRASSTIGDELRENPFILRKSYDDFLDLKKNWMEYKRIHGIA